MSTTKLYKLDNGNSYATNCFPARNILRTSEEGAGHWLVAHRAAQKTKFEAMICAKSLQEKVGGTPQYMEELQHHGYTDEMVQENMLDGPFLINLHCVKIPSDLCSVDISNKNLVSAKEDDFEQFDSVAYINATENLLTLEAFHKFSGLRELELSLNGLRNLKISAGDFLHLEILDLSYNNLSPEDVRTLGVLSQLKVLHLTANGLRSLPSDLTVSENDSPSCLKFPSLEVLLLDDNYLSHPSVFVSLANLRSLKQLNLDKNGIAEVPYLHQMENSQFSLHPQLARMGTKAESRSFPSRFGQKHEQPLQGGGGLQGQLVTEKEQLEYLILQNNQDPDRTEVVFTSASREPPLLDVFMERNDRSCLADAGTPPTSFRNTLSQEFTPPFPELRYLSLANNKIKNEEDLLAVALFPSLAELTFHSNPLTTLRSGDPPLLTSFLQHRLGIKLIRRKISKLEKPHIFIPVKANRKVTSHVPKVPKQPLMLDAPLESSFWKLWSDTEGGKLEESEEGSHRLSLSDPLPPIRPSSAQQHQEPYDDTKMLGSHREMPEKEKCDSKLAPASAEDDIEFFFLTQLDDADDISSSVWRHELEERQGKRKQKSRTSGSCTYIPMKYKGYEELLRVKTDPEFIEPAGMQQNVQALRRALKQPLVYRDSKARLDSVQKPYVPRKKKMGKPPGPPSRKTKAEVLENVLRAMRGNVNIREVPLVSVLRKKKSNRRAYQEALGLMKEFHQKYKAALATSNKAICKESVTIPELGQSPTQETFVEIEESKSETLPQDTDESESLNHYLSLEKSSSRKRSGVTFAL
ncbi:X-ray radiation resistance-associated protein 1 [Chelonoidis abingdonii]|uniref:X-ray radiation resistance-associated protein 1 n=1 Tax=Chelonoidis abingdonii TaxID=106734 RepID=UPI0013F2A88D|nr:X-ray radiation resistance-associated protein 1 [Chelonoidis abingdonii]XP_032637048.1 X-ray radiation resistance-associated protein 1 [Chelonoidis abingdonii]